MTLGIFVEGASDKQTIPILIKKLGYTRSIHVRFVRQGQMLDFAEMSQQIAALKRLHSQVRKVLIFRDSEGANPEETFRRTEGVCAQLNQAIRGVQVAYVIVDHSLEGWLACDAEALRQVLAPNARVNIRGNPEDLPRPATLMERIFRENGKRFVKTVHNQKISGLVNPQTILSKSPTFQRFVSILNS